MTDPGQILFDEAARSRRRLRLAAGAAAVVTLLCYVSGLGSSIDYSLFDTWLRIRGNRAPSPQVVVVAIDDKSIASMGTIPWPRRHYAPLVEKLSEAGAKVIGFDVAFAPNADQDLPLAVPGGANLTTASNNAQFAAALQSSGHVVIGYLFDNVGDPSPPGATPPDYLAGNSISIAGRSDLHLVPSPSIHPSEPVIASAAAALGHVNAAPDEDGNIRWFPLFVRHADRAYPSLALQVARLYTGTPMDGVRLGSQHVTLAYADIPIATNGQQLVNWTGPDLGFPVYSIVDVIRGDVPASAFRGKAVLIGATAKGADEKQLPFLKNAPGVLLHATILDNIFTLSFLSWPTWAWLLEIGMVLGLALLGVMLYPRLTTTPLLLVGASLLVLTLGLALYLLIAKGVWLRALYPALAVALPLGATLARKLRESEKQTRDVEAEKVENQRLLGLSFQEKGMLDMAFATFSKLPPSPDLAVVYHSLGLDFENRGHPEKAFLAYQRALEMNHGHAEAAERLERLRAAGVGTRVFSSPTLGLASGAPTAITPTAPTAITPTVPNTAGASDVDATRPVAPSGASSASGADEQPTIALAKPPTLDARQVFGRYEILEKLGRGAMGEVFRVRDPKLERIAAMKIIRLDIELGAQQLIELRQRFYREAQTAGKLTHPNIVTIYDVGEEQGISYIVMEYVEGQTLSSFIKKRTERLRVPQIKHVIIQAALGLQYAHEHGVVHRDVKPDNIMITKAGLIKVMDFGIARIVDSDMTRTGSVLGTPAYMSPEQFSAQKVDARSDVFSLGVVLFELLTRTRPFGGTTATAMMFEILQKAPPNPSDVDAGVSAAWNPVVQKALAKAQDDRYASAAAFAAAVRAVKAD